ncbi:MAG: manganese ABC transporter ATP-binding protein [Verrucomicrobiales bacterium]|nr:manganese ABC transporter ATP-binding protein [Verrucomicrobiales bacterium]MBD28276.1 manganese ABC transporter ATP-binding protein [Verrucomicrobiaceae bacterium]MBV63080.1 manganese ABC transporter ATP-binding protein [Rickettsiales bacterium]|tara:strand:- start:565 stop:1341 length:777 start_codon:yes stop_codon:yes gene_type:complete
MSTESQKCPALEIHDLIVSYQKKPVLYGVDLAVPEGSMVGVVGPNGAGKSTLIKTVMGLVSHAHGWVKVFGGELRDSIKRVGYVPQRESVDWDFPVSVMDVVLMGCYGRSGLIKRPGKMEKEKAMQALEKVGLEAYSKRQISNLSGGQQQRVFLARALAQESDLYLMDEPFAGVDAATEVAIVDLLGQIRDQGKTLIVVHHDLATAREYFDMILLLNMRVVGFGKTNEVFNSELLQKTYGGRLTVLSEIAGEVAKQER